MAVKSSHNLHQTISTNHILLSSCDKASLAHQIEIQCRASKVTLEWFNKIKSQQS